MLAISANKFPGKDVVEYFLFAARRLLVLFVDGVHLFPNLLGDDGRKYIVILFSLMGDYARIALIMQDDIDIFLVDEFAVLPSDIAFFQIVGNGICLKSLGILSENLPHGIGLCFIDDVFFVLDDVAERRDAARGISLDPTFAQASVDLLPQIFRIVLIESLDDRLKEFPFWRVGNVLHRRYQTDAVIGEFFAVDDRLIHVTGKPVKFVNDDHAPLSSLTVREHLLECRTVVVCPCCGAVDIFVHHKEIVLFRILFADMKLTFDGLLRRK